MSAAKQAYPGALNVRRNTWVSLLDNLQTLLEKQIELARAGNISSLEVLSEKSESLVQRIAEAGILERPEFLNRRRRLRKLYDGLSLALTAQKAETCENLTRVRKGRKTIGTYRSSI